jgi:N-acetylmuramoyl-L-alanine amidase
MDAAALAGLCALLARGMSAQPLPAGVNCPAAMATLPSISAAAAPPSGSTSLAARLGGADTRDAIARIAFAEAANQGDSGLAAVVYTIMNRLQDGRWGSTVEAVLNARGQFEPVMRAGGSWRNLPVVSEAQRARVNTIINLAIEGRLPDLTNGARFFQNAQIVAARESAGTVSPGLTNFGSAPASAVIGAHTFYVEAARGEAGRGGRVTSPRRPPVTGRGAPGTANDGIFVGENRAFPAPLVAAPPTQSDRLLAATPATLAADAEASPAVGHGDPTRTIFVLSDGRASERLR